MTDSAPPSSSISAERETDRAAPTGRLFVVSGPSGAGKSSVVAGLRKRRPLYFSVSATTREARPGETHGVHYWFLQPEEFTALLDTGDLLEWAEYNGRQYGTLRKPVVDHISSGEDVLLEIEVQGARQVRATHPEAVMFFIVPPGLDELEGRLRGRGDTSEADIRRRLQIAAREMEEAEMLFDHVVVNDVLERAIEQVDRLMG
ncbi:MAG: guanylate kinase [Acidimicrobiia bacterium]